MSEEPRKPKYICPYCGNTTEGVVQDNIISCKCELCGSEWKPHAIGPEVSGGGAAHVAREGVTEGVKALRRRNLRRRKEQENQNKVG